MSSFVLRIVESHDGLIPDQGDFDILRRIIHEVRGIKRVVLDVPGEGKPSARCLTLQRCGLGMTG